MLKIEYFDYLKVAREYHVPHEILATILKETRTEFAKDKMMFELHVMRAIKSLYWKKEIIKPVSKRKRRLSCSH